MYARLQWTLQGFPSRGRRLDEGRSWPRGSGTLLDHPVRPLYEGLRNRQTKRLRSRGIDDQLELRGLLDGKVGGLGPPEDLIDVSSGQPNNRIEVRPVTE